MANGIIDTFIHTIEQYVTYPAEGRFQDRTSEGILQTLLEIDKKTIDDPTDYDARANLVLCSTMALNAHRLRCAAGLVCAYDRSRTDSPARTRPRTVTRRRTACYVEGKKNTKKPRNSYNTLKEF